MCLSKCEDAHTSGCNPQIKFCYFFLSSVIFGLKACRHWVSCERNSFYSFTQIFLKLCRCFVKVCMKFGCNPQIKFCYFFRNSQFVFGLKETKSLITDIFRKKSFPIICKNRFKKQSDLGLPCLLFWRELC